MATIKKNKGYLGNQNLKQENEIVEITFDQQQEYAMCMIDPIYFITKYVKIVSLDHGIVPFQLYEYQKRFIMAMHENRKVIGMMPRQMGKTTTAAAYLCWYLLFSENEAVTVAILANKASAAREIMSRLQQMYEALPKWMQKGVKEWNKGSIELASGAKAFTAATSASGIRGKSVNFLYIDEAAIIPNNVADEFFTSTYPTISAGDTTKIVLTSTPLGLNHFWKYWVEAEQKINGFVPIDIHYSEHPKRDQKWADEQEKLLGTLKFRQEVLCTFLGSANTLIDGAKLSKFPMMKPEQIFPEYCEYYPPSRDEKGNQNGNYIITVDTSRGADLDSSAFVVIDISVMPYKVVAKYKCSTVSTLMYPEVIHKVALRYNNAFVLIETNDLGQQVADILFYDLEYENVYMSYRDTLKEGGSGNSGKKPGLRTTKKTKSIGCSTLKILVESDHIELNDSDIIAELQHFVRVGASYKAEEGYHDDLVMCLVMFSYLTQEEVFKQLFDFSLRHEFIKKQMNEFEDQLDPIGFVDRGIPDEEVPTVQMGGDLWFEVNVGDPW